MTRFLIALLALLGLAAQAPASARVSDARPSVGVVALERTAIATRAVRHAGVVEAVLAPIDEPAPAALVRLTGAAPVAVPAVLVRIDRAHE